jgi:hypothetical protein
MRSIWCGTIGNVGEGLPVLCKQMHIRETHEPERWDLISCNV